MFRVTLFFALLLGLLTSAFGISVASDDSGKYLAAVDSKNVVYVSNDYGKTWTTTSASGQEVWSDITSDSSGKNLALANIGAAPATLPYTSKDEGATWVKAKNGYASSNYKIASDGTGNNLVVGTSDNLYTSDDGGASWLSADITQYNYGTGVAYSADGSTVVYSSNNQISMHRNGSFWSWCPSPAASWVSVSTSIKGTVGAGVYNIGYYPNAHDDRGVYITKDWTTFTPLVVTPGPTVFNDIDVTDDGSLVFYGGSGGVYVYNVAKNTTVHGDLPATTSAPVLSLATSKTGKYAVAGTAANIYVSSNYGANFVKVM